MTTKQIYNNLYENSIEDQFHSLQKQYDSLLKNYKILERKEALSKEEAKFARSVVIEYSNGLSIYKWKYNRFKKELEKVLNQESESKTKLYEMRKILRSQDELERR